MYTPFSRTLNRLFLIAALLITPLCYGESATQGTKEDFLRRVNYQLGLVLVELEKGQRAEPAFPDANASLLRTYIEIEGLINAAIFEGQSALDTYQRADTSMPRRYSVNP